MKEKHNPLPEDRVRVIKIGREALLELIYEWFIGSQGQLMDVDAVSMQNAWSMDFENGQFLFCACPAEDAEGNFREIPQEISLPALLRRLPDTADSVLTAGEKPYRDYTVEELIRLSGDGSDASD